MILKIIKYILLGGIQGLTEPLPISSSAHMSLCAILLGLEENSLFFEVLINFASVLAVGLFFKNDFKFLKENKSFLKNLFISTIPCGIIGIILHNHINSNLSNLTSLSISFYITTLFLILTSLLFKKKQKDEISYKDALFLGLAQSFALTPGISRCGTVLFGGSLLKIDEKVVLKYSFFMYMIVSTCATSFTFVKGLIDKNIFLNYESIILYLISFITCFFTTYISLKWFHKIINNKSLLIFAGYTFILASIIWLFWA